MSKPTEDSPASKEPEPRPMTAAVWDAIGSEHGFCNPIKARLADEDDDDE